MYGSNRILSLRQQPGTWGAVHVGRVSENTCTPTANSRSKALYGKRVAMLRLTNGKLRNERDDENEAHCSTARKRRGPNYAWADPKTLCEVSCCDEDHIGLREYPSLMENVRQANVRGSPNSCGNSMNIARSLGAVAGESADDHLVDLEVHQALREKSYWRFVEPTR